GVSKKGITRRGGICPRRSLFLHEVKSMKKLLFAGLALFSLAVPASALVIAPPPGPARMAQADVILTGRVVGIEPQDVQVEPFLGAKEKIKLRVAVVKVNDKIRGLK